MRVQAARPRGHRLPETIWKATMRPPPASSRYAATEIAERPAARPNRVPVRPPVPQRSPDSTRHRTPARGRCRAAVYAVTEKDMEDRSCDEMGWVAEARRTGPPNRRKRVSSAGWTRVAYRPAQERGGGVMGKIRCTACMLPTAPYRQRQVFTAERS